jgi:hypothetical protein
VQHTCLEYHVGIVPITALANVAKVLATTDSDGAARLTGDAENIAQSITIESLKATALATVAKVLATTDPDGAARLTGDAENIAQSITIESLKALPGDRGGRPTGVVEQAVDLP